MRQAELCRYSFSVWIVGSALCNPHTPARSIPLPL
ncbi:unnamed protein product [Ectocarpus sp. CCAP 1310/34]|nr:unnamed protein product [Ectocarpus sp. CCAP 1310/34]